MKLRFNKPLWFHCFYCMQGTFTYHYFIWHAYCLILLEPTTINTAYALVVRIAADKYFLSQKRNIVFVFSLFINMQVIWIENLTAVCLLCLMHKLLVNEKLNNTVNTKCKHRKFHYKHPVKVFFPHFPFQQHTSSFPGQVPFDFPFPLPPDPSGLFWHFPHSPIATCGAEFSLPQNGL